MTDRCIIEGCDRDRGRFAGRDGNTTTSSFCDFHSAVWKDMCEVITKHYGDTKGAMPAVHLVAAEH